MIKSYRYVLLAMVPAVLVACSSMPSEQTPPTARAHYSEFTDSTWQPESYVRAPYGAAEIVLPITQALMDGAHAFDGTDESVFRLESSGDETYVVTETRHGAGEKALSWGTGASVLYRNGLAVTDWGKANARLLPDGRLLVKVRGKADVNYAVKLTAYNIAGKPIRQILRDANNQPDTLAWYMREDKVFPSGSVAYRFTYWLGDNEVIQPFGNAFTGASTLEKLLKNFTGNQPYCLSYIDHTRAHPYAVAFEKDGATAKRSAVLRNKKRAVRSVQVPEKGRYVLYNADPEALFCQKSADATTVSGNWTIQTIHGTRVLEMTRPDTVAESDLGIQPVNAKSVGIGFAEVLTPKATTGYVRQVIPVRILKNNEPIADFRIKFNGIAADAVRDALVDAARSQKAEETLKKETTPYGR